MNGKTLKNRVIAALRKSERFTQTDMVYLAKGGFWQVAERMAGIASGLIATWAFANLLTPQVYGEYKYVLSIAGLLTTFSLTGVSVAVAKSVATGHEKTYKDAFNVAYKYSALLILLSITGSIYYFLNGNTGLGTGLLLIALFQPIFNSANIYANYLIGKKSFAEKAKLTTIQGTALNVGLILGLLVTKNLIMILALYFSLNSLICLLLYLKIFRQIPKDASSDPGFVRYAKQLSIVRVIGYIASQIDSVLLFQLVGSVELATYNITIAIPVQIKNFNKNIAGVAFAKFAVNGEKQTASRLLRKGGLYFLLLLGAALTYILLAPGFFSIFFPQYPNAVFPTQLFALTIPFSVRLIFQALFEAKGRVREQYTISVFSGAMLVVTYLLLIPPFGLMGAIYARLISRVSTTFLCTYFLWRMGR